MKESKICSYQADKFRLQLVEISYLPGENQHPIKYQIRLNRRIINTSISEYTMRRLFAMEVQNHVLQLKIW